MVARFQLTGTTAYAGSKEDAMRRQCEFCGLLVGLLLAATGVASASTIHVPGDLSTIGAAIAAASSGDSILVAAGTYTGLSNRNLDFEGKSLTLIGPAGSSATIIDCEQHARGFYLHTGEDSTSIVSGFTIRNGHATEGGGIACEDASPTIVDCVLAGNSATIAGGGLYCHGGSPTVRRCDFVGNTAAATEYSNGGGGMHCSAAAPKIISCRFSGNSAGFGGGLCCMFEACPTVSNCTFQENTAILSDGGGVFCYGGSEPSISGCTLVGNTAELSGGGLYCDNSSPTVDDVRFESNVAFSADMPCGGGGVCLVGSAPSISGCEFIGNSSARGGGIHCRSASLPEIKDATFDGNAGTAGGGIYCREQSAAQIVRAIFTNGSAVSGGGLYADSSAPSVQESFFDGNTASGTDVTNGGGAIHLYKSSATIERCAFIDNVGVRGGAVHVRGVFEGTIGFSTFAGNHGLEGAGIFGRTTSVSLANCILASGHGSVAAYCTEDASISLSCSDIFGNSGGDWVGCIASQLGQDGNICADPLFCGGSDPDEAYGLQGTSPCAAENCLCGQMGRWGVACAGTAVHAASWTEIKARYR